MTPLPKRGFGPPSYGTFSTPLTCQCPVFFIYRNPRQSRPEALLEGSKNFRESAFSGTFSTPHTFCTPHITAQALWPPILTVCFLCFCLPPTRDKFRNPELQDPFATPSSRCHVCHALNVGLANPQQSFDRVTGSLSITYTRPHPQRTNVIAVTIEVPRFS